MIEFRKLLIRSDDARASDKSLESMEARWSRYPSQASIVPPTMMGTRTAAKIVAKYFLNKLRLNDPVVVVTADRLCLLAFGNAISGRPGLNMQGFQASQRGSN